jgi:hypothetical protein
MGLQMPAKTKSPVDPGASRADEEMSQPHVPTLFMRALHPEWEKEKLTSKALGGKEAVTEPPVNHPAAPLHPVDQLEQKWAKEGFWSSITYAELAVTLVWLLLHLRGHHRPCLLQPGCALKVQGISSTSSNFWNCTNFGWIHVTFLEVSKSAGLLFLQLFQMELCAGTVKGWFSESWGHDALQVKLLSITMSPMCLASHIQDMPIDSLKVSLLSICHASNCIHTTVDELHYALCVN